MNIYEELFERFRLYVKIKQSDVEDLYGLQINLDGSGCIWFDCNVEFSFSDLHELNHFLVSKTYTLQTVYNLMLSYNLDKADSIHLEIHGGEKISIVSQGMYKLHWAHIAEAIKWFLDKLDEI